jgi:hypothetical protein
MTGEDTATGGAQRRFHSRCGPSCSPPRIPPLLTGKAALETLVHAY